MLVSLLFQFIWNSARAQYTCYERPLTNIEGLIKKLKISKDLQKKPVSRLTHRQAHTCTQHTWFYYFDFYISLRKQTPRLVVGLFRWTLRPPAGEIPDCVCSMAVKWRGEGRIVVGKAEYLKKTQRSTLVRRCYMQKITNTWDPAVRFEPSSLRPSL